MQPRLIQHQPHLAEKHVNQALPLLDNHIETEKAQKPEHKTYAWKTEKKNEQRREQNRPHAGKKVHITFSSP